ncbi:MAG: hypothetical protein J7647_18460 [Cyanobacteria bacterium SBLK]|nr:hypothetical protein [Cyanobacteria bacterium SBLK]
MSISDTVSAIVRIFIISCRLYSLHWGKPSETAEFSKLRRFLRRAIAALRDRP